jgi:acetyltransferase-like isoleucine patch superfamily enzyme
MSVTLIKQNIKTFCNYLRLIRKNNNICDLCKIDIASQVKGSFFAAGVSTARNCSIIESKVGRYTSIGRNTKVSHADIGSFCAISWDCTINALAHPMERLTVSAFPYVPHVGHFVKQRSQKYNRVVIGNDVWVGAQAIIMPGVIIGNGAVIGAGSIVTKDVQPYEIVVGNPAKHHRWRFSTEIIEILCRLKWWEWPDDKIRHNISLFQEEITIDLLESLRDA